MKRSGPIKRKRSPSDFPAALKQTILERGCQASGYGFALDAPCSGGLHAHHRRFRSQGGQGTLDNACCLCSAHHTLAHGSGRRDAEACGVVLRGSSG